MIKSLIKPHHHQSLLEEILNAITHGVGVGLSIAALVLLVVYATIDGGVLKIVSAAVYGSSLVIMYLASTLYHAFPHSKLKKAFKVFDHASIYLLIAGTYTPFALVSFQGVLGWTLFGVVWGLAAFGLVFKLFFTGRYEILSVIIYVFMGWLAIFAIVPIYHALPFAGFVWLILGGMSYTLGVTFYVIDHKIHLTHAIWHLFVLAGSICHFFAVLWYVLPTTSH